MHGLKIEDVFTSAEVISSILREDSLYVNKEGTHYTTKRREGFQNFSEIFRRFFPEYITDKNHCAIPHAAKTLNFINQKQMLTSSKLTQFEEYNYATGPKLLDKTVSMDLEKVALCSYPKSGSSYLRLILERVTGLATGSSVDLGTATSLQT